MILPLYLHGYETWKIISRLLKLKYWQQWLHSDYEKLINGNIRTQIAGNKFYTGKQRAHVETMDSNTIMKIAVKRTRT
jgi:hypothetical protein